MQYFIVEEAKDMLFTSQSGAREQIARRLVKSDFEYCVRLCHQMAQDLQDYNLTGIAMVSNLLTHQVLYKVTITEDILEVLPCITLSRRIIKHHDTYTKEDCSLPEEQPRLICGAYENLCKRDRR